MLFVATGKVRIEALKDDHSGGRIPGGGKPLAEYVVPGSLSFFGIYQADNISGLSTFLRSRRALDLDTVQPVLHLENLLILEGSPPSTPPGGQENAGL